jgi:hypothetical protein
MKKFLSVILGLTLVFSLVGCSSMNKEVLTTESFQTYFEGKEDYKVFDITYQCEGQNIKTALASDDVKDGYSLEYYIYEDEASAQKMYDETVEIIAQFVKEPLVEEGENYKKYSGANSSIYWSLTKVENTVLYCEAALVNQEEISLAVKGLGY